MPRGFGLVFAAVFAASAAVSGPENPVVPGDPLAKVEAVVRAAWNGGALTAFRAGLDAREAGVLGEIHPGAPYTELAREGIDSGFSKAPNAATYLRLGMPFNAPWQRPSGRDFVRSTRDHAGLAARMEALRIATDAVSAWLDLATAIDRKEVIRQRVARLDRALVLYRKRLELGEVAGSEVYQIELQRARETADLAQVESDASEATARLASLTRGGAPVPAPGDLTRLREALGPIQSEGVLAIAVRHDPLPLRLARRESERVRREGIHLRKTSWGRPEFELSYENLPALDDAESSDSIGARLVIPLPFGDLGKHRAAEAAARVREAVARENVARAETEARIEAALSRLEAAAGALDTLGASEREAQAIEHSLSEQFRLGAINYLAYLDGLSRLDEVRAGAIEARRTELLARLELAALIDDPAMFALPDPDEEPE
jgi:outer membrane protein TolC